MSSEREAAGMRVALMSYDERELRVRKFYLEEQSPTISCTCFQSGEPVLEALRKAWCFDVLVLSGQLEDMDSLTFIERLNQLPNRPARPHRSDGRVPLLRRQDPHRIAAPAPPGTLSAHPQNTAVGLNRIFIPAAKPTKTAAPSQAPACGGVFVRGKNTQSKES